MVNYSTPFTDESVIGRLKEVPGVFDQGETLEGLQENIRDVYRAIPKSEMSHPEGLLLTVFDIH
jgi:predicted RNase H-like HicB family nuclease